MSHADPKPSGWVTKEKLLSAQMNLVRTAINNSPDFVGGGTYAPAAPVIVNGTGTFQIGSQLAYTSRALTRVLPLTPISLNGANFTHQNAEHFIICSNTSGAALELPLGRLPHGAVLNTVAVHYQGATGHAAFPGGQPTMPTVKVYRKPASSITLTQIGATATDSSANVATYEASHKIQTAALAHTIDTANNVYFVVFNSESAGAGAAISGARVIGLECNVTITVQNEF